MGFGFRNDGLGDREDRETRNAGAEFIGKVSKSQVIGRKLTLANELNKTKVSTKESNVCRRIGAGCSG